MADNVAITAGSGTTIATDDCTTGHVQVVKLAYGADGDRTQVAADADGLLVNLGANNDVTVTGTVTANLAAGTNNIGDVDVLTVPAPLSTTGGGTEATALRVTIATDSTGVLSVDDNGSTLSIDDGAGSITVDNGGTFAVQVSSISAGDNNIGNVDIVTMPATVTEDAPSSGGETAILIAGVRNDAAASKTSLDGDFGNIAIDAAGRVGVADLGGSISVDDNAGSLTIDNAALSVTGGGVEASALRVTLASDSTGVLSVDDNGASLTVDNSTLSVVGNGTAATAMRVTVASDSTGSIAVTNAGTFAVQATLQASTNTTEVVGDAAHDAPASGNPVLGGGYASAAAPTSVSLDGDVVRSWHLLNGAQATVITAAGALIGGDATNGLDVDVTRLPAPLTTTGTGTEATALRVTIATDSTGVLSVDDNGASLTVDNGGTFAVQDSEKVADNGGFTDGTTKVLPAGFIYDEVAGTALTENDVGAARMDVKRAMIGVIEDATTRGQRAAVSSAGALSTAPAGNVAHDAADSGNPVKIGLKAESSPKGITLVADGDRTDAYADLDGIQITKIGTANGDLISERIADTGGTSTAFTNFSAVASTRNYVTAIAVFNSSAGACYVDFRDGTGGSVLWTMYCPAGGGSVITSAIPLFKTTANTALAYDVSGATTTCYINVSGYQSKA